MKQLYIHVFMNMYIMCACTCIIIHCKHHHHHHNNHGSFIAYINMWIYVHMRFAKLFASIKTCQLWTKNQQQINERHLVR